MLTTLSILSLDQGPKWHEPEPEGTTAPEVDPEGLRAVPQAMLAVFVALFKGDRQPAASRTTPMIDFAK